MALFGTPWVDYVPRVGCVGTTHSLVVSAHAHGCSVQSTQLVFKSRKIIYNYHLPYRYLGILPTNLTTPSRE